MDTVTTQEHTYKGTNNADEEKRIDELLKAAVKGFVDSVPVRGKEEGWLRIERELYSKAPKPRTSVITLTLIVACLSGIVVLAALYQIPAVKAWSSNVIIKYREILPGRVRDYVTTISPAPDEPIAGYRLSEVDGQIAEAFASLPFSPLVPVGSENGWVLHGTDVKKIGPDIYLILEFRNEQGHRVRLIEQPLRKAHNHSILYDQDEATLSKHSVRKVDVALLAHDNGTTSAWWYEEGLSLSLACTGDENTALAFIKQLIKYERGP